MPATFQHEEANLYRAVLSGLLTKTELNEVQFAAAIEIERVGRLRVLVELADFKGFERGADWGDLSFAVKHGNDLERIAIVGDEKWQVPALMFAGAGLRRAPVRFFGPADLAKARAWLLAEDAMG